MAKVSNVKKDGSQLSVEARRQLNAYRRIQLADLMATLNPADPTAVLVWNNDVQACEVIKVRRGTLTVRPRLIVGGRVMTDRACVVSKDSVFTSLPAAKKSRIKRLKQDAVRAEREIKRIRALKHTKVAA